MARSSPGDGRDEGDIAQELPAAEQELFLAVQGQSFGPMFDEKLTACAWKTKPCWHVISANDRMLPPAMEESSAKKLGGPAITLPTCHLVILEQPEKVAAVIDEAAKKSLRIRKSWRQLASDIWLESSLRSRKRL